MNAAQHIRRIRRSSPGGARAVPRASTLAAGIFAVLLALLGALVAAPAQARAVGLDTRAPVEARSLAITDTDPGLTDTCLNLPSDVYACAVWGGFDLTTYIQLPGQVFCGPSICSYLLMQTDGNLVLYHSCTGMFGPYHAVWAANTQYSAGTHAVMQTDGNFVVYTASGSAVWATGTNGNTNAWLAIQYDGNLVIYAAPDPPNIDNFPRPIWATGTNYC